MRITVSCEGTQVCSEHPCLSDKGCLWQIFCSLVGGHGAMPNPWEHPSAAAIAPMSHLYPGPISAWHHPMTMLRYRQPYEFRTFPGFVSGSEQILQPSMSNMLEADTKWEGHEKTERMIKEIEVKSKVIPTSTA